MKPFYRLISGLCILLPLHQAAARTWTSADGRTMTAEILDIDCEARSVRFLRDDGLEFTSKWELFSEADIRHLKQRCAEKAAATLEDKQDKASEKTQKPETQPDKLILNKVPMVEQEGAYCVPASAAMIAGFHGIKTDQFEIARLSSSGSEGHQGTYPKDMSLAMSKLGFSTQSRYWEADKDNLQPFYRDILPYIRNSLCNDGPLYVSFKPGVFGDSGHGCVIIGYDHRREKLYLHNPWGEAFDTDYEDFAVNAHGIVRVLAPQDVPPADDAYLDAIKKALPMLPDSLNSTLAALDRAELPHSLRWCNRRDERDDRRFAEQTARKEGRKILELAFTRSPAVLIPLNQDDALRGIYLITEAEAGARFNAHLIDASGWREPTLMNIGDFSRSWVTGIKSNGRTLWELPLIELRSLPHEK